MCEMMGQEWDVEVEGGIRALISGPASKCHHLVRGLGAS
jgi:hypothetical protein